MSTPLPPRDRRRLTRLALLAPALGAAAFALALAVTDPPGPGLDPDAMAYLGAAVSLARAGRYDVPAASWASADSVAPLTHFPPGFPTAIALPVRLGMAPAQGARLVVALAAFATVTIAVWTVGAAAGAWAGALAALLLVATPALVNAHLSVLSEPLFLACIAAALGLMARPAAPEWRPASARRALALGAVGAAAALVRYAGISVPAAAALWLLLERTTARRATRLRNAALAAAPALVLVGAWGARNALLAGARAHEPRRPRPYLAGFGDDLGLGARTVRDWLAPLVEPERARWLAAGAALLLVVLLVAAALRRAGRAATADETRAASASVPPVARVLAAGLLLLAAYLGELIASRLFVYGTIPFDERILAPVILLAELAVAAALGGWWPRRRARGGASRAAAAFGLRATAALAVAAWLAGSVAVTRRNVAYVVANGSDFAGAQWRESPLLAYVRARARDRALYSNWPAAIYFHTGRAARDLPVTLDSATLAAFATRLAATGGVVVAFDAPSPDVAPPDSIARRLGLRRVRRFADGAVWRAGGEGAARR